MTFLLHLLLGCLFALPLHLLMSPCMNQSLSLSLYLLYMYMVWLINYPSEALKLIVCICRLDYEVAELTWENGQVAMHGLGLPRPPAKPSLTTAKYTTWDKPRASGTLESIVNQATSTLPLPSKPPFDSSGGGSNGELVSWFDHHRAAAVRSTEVTPSTTMTMDALVPCRNQSDNSSSHMMESMSMPVVISGSDVVGCSTGVESCSGATGAATQDDDTMLSGKHGSLSRVPETPEWSSRSQSVSGSATFGMDSHPVTLDSTKASDHDSVCHSRPQANSPYFYSAN